MIQHLDVSLKPGFTVLTGETGAGKSIILGAMGLLLGNRTSSNVIRSGESKCVVEGSFNVENLGLKPLFDAEELDYDNVCTIRREVSDNGKTRAFVNDTPVNLQQLKNISSRLIDIHSQHENLLLNESGFQMHIVDALAKDEKELSDYSTRFEVYKKAETELEELRGKAEKYRSDHEYLQFQFDKLHEAALKEGEQIELESELEMLNHSEEVQTDLSHAINNLDSDEFGINTQLRDALNALHRVEKFVPKTEGFSKRVESALIDLQDVESELEVLANDTEFDPNRKTFVEERLDVIYTLEQKHKVATVEELLSIEADLEEQLQTIDNFDNHLSELQKKYDAALQTLTQSAASLTAKRTKVLPEIEKDMREKLVYLEIPNGQFKVDLQPSDEFLSNGKDNVQFLFSANKNNQLQPVAAIASGGEMARVMLAVKSLIVSKSELPTIVFDEIDTGVSGEVGHRMGEMMQQISRTVQVIAITHLPQIAAKGSSHFKVYKQDTDTSTETHIEQLTLNQRIVEIAELLNGKNPSEAALKNAEEMLS